ncbi:MAG: hypothetical protein PVH29_02440 [Candidatus Zixiibacteriota bacterium]|jgi:hypothetical protein
MKKLTVVLASVALLALACGGEELGAVKGPTPADTAPAFALRNIEKACEQRNIELVEEALAWNFVFHFNAEDVGQKPPGGKEYVIPESWDYYEFRTAVYNMFVAAYSIDLSINKKSVDDPPPEAETYLAEGVTISFLVMSDELRGYIANQGHCDFAFEKYYNESDEPRWRLTGWWDDTHTAADGYPGVSPSTLGRMLAMYQ